jgi:hypothetical protein
MRGILQEFTELFRGGEYNIPTFRQTEGPNNEFDVEITLQRGNLSNIFLENEIPYNSFAARIIYVVILWRISALSEYDTDEKEKARLLVKPIFLFTHIGYYYFGLQ